jgi:predicted transcriptional regulator
MMTKSDKIKGRATGPQKALLIAIRKPYSQLILLGQKKYELRKRPPRIECEYAFIYETLPTKAVIGYFRISKVIQGSAEKVWNIVTTKSCVEEVQFFEYYKNKSNAVAFEIEETKRFESPISLAELGIKHVPQDFIYVNHEEICNLIGV